MAQQSFIERKMEKRFKRRYRTAKHLLAAAAVILLLLFGLYRGKDAWTSPAVTPLGDKEVQFHFMDVGQGDAALIRTPDGNILIDAGTSDAEQDLKAYLDSLGVTDIEYAVFTHPHEDHIGGADMVLSHYTVKHVVLPDVSAKDQSYQNMINALQKESCRIIKATPNTIFRVGELTCTILAPLHTGYAEVNDSSVVLRADYGDTSVLYMGDAEFPAEKELLTRYGKAPGGLLDCDLIKVGHHGSDTSSDENFLAAVTPGFAVISCGKGNSHGHPMQATLARYASMNVTIHRTDREGNIMFSTVGGELIKK